MMKFRLIAGAVLLMFWGACDNASSSADSEENFAVDSREDLPRCTALRDGTVAYVIETEEKVACFSGEWKNVNSGEKIESSSSANNESSSSSAKNVESSSSEKRVSSSSVESSSSIVIQVSSSSETGADDELSSSSSQEVSSSSRVIEVTVETGTMTDERDDQEYKTVKIGDQVWMAENLNYSGAEVIGASALLGWCYDNDDDYCATYGRLYNWKTATKACPSGWHLPDTAEWNGLVYAIGDSLTAGAKLKSAVSWTGDDGNGEDTYGFTALPGGFRKEDYYDGQYYDIHKFANFWTSSTKDDSYAYHMTIRFDNAKISTIADPLSYSLSVRCVKD